MLVLSRKNRERILIGENIWVEVVESRDGRVRLGITAPSGVSVLREELVPTSSIDSHASESSMALESVV